MYKNTADEMLEEFKSSRQGLSAEERAQRRQEYGYNELLNFERRSFLSFFGESFSLNIQKLLLLATVFFAYLGRFYEAGVFLAILFFRAIVSSGKSFMAQRARERFQQENIGRCRVLEEGEPISLPIRELVPGDVVLLERGDIVPADGRLIKGDDIWIDESLLTGSKEPFCKDANFVAQDNIPLGERANMIYGSTLVCDGQGQMLVTTTGMATEIGKVAFMLYKDSDKKSPMEEKLIRQSNIINGLVLVFSLAIGVYGYFKGLNFLELIFVVLSLSMAATIKDFSGLVQELKSRNSLRFFEKGVSLREIASIEKLGSVSVAIFDEFPFISKGGVKVRDLSFTNDEDELFMKKIFLLIAREEDGSKNDLAKALRDFSLVENPFLDRKIEAYEHLATIESQGLTKLHRSVYDTDEGILSFALGNSSEVLSLSTKYNNGIETLDIDEEISQGILAMEQQFNLEGKKALALAYRLDDKKHEKDYHFLGLVALGDVGSEGVKDTIKTLKNAGVFPILLSSSSVEVGSQLARETGLLIPGYEIMTGEHMDSLSDEELLSVVDNYSVYFDMNLSRRQRLVESWKVKGETVALTLLDMENLASIEKADISLATLENATAVVRSKSDLLIPEDDLSGFTDALAEARMVFLNMRRRVRFDLVISMALMFSSLIVMGVFGQMAYSFMGLLWLGLVVRVFPELALEKEPMERNVLFQNPPRMDRGLIQSRSLALSIFEGLLMGATVVVAFIIFPPSVGNFNVSLSYLTFGFGILLLALNLRNSQSVLGRGFFANRLFFLSFVVTGLLVIFPIILQILAGVFGMKTLPLQYWGLALGLAFIPVVITELRKIFIRE